MAVSGARKAAMLLMSLDPSTGAQLLRSARPDSIAEIAAEVQYLRENREARDEAVDSIVEFFQMLVGRARSGGFVQRLLDAAVGVSESPKLMAEVQQRMRRRDPFVEIRRAEPAALAEALASESGRVAAIVLAELPPEASAAVLELLPAETRPAVVQSMTAGQPVSPEARMRIAEAIQSRLAAAADEDEDQPVAPKPAEGGQVDPRLRRSALVLRRLDADTRQELLDGLTSRDAEAAQAVVRMMVLWEDLPEVTDRSLQGGLRGIGAGELALALMDADERTAAKIRNNVSERLRATIAEEASLISSPKAADIEQAREQILDSLRELNAAGELQFDQGGGP